MYHGVYKLCRSKDMRILKKNRKGKLKYMVVRQILCYLKVDSAKSAYSKL